MLYIERVLRSVLAFFCFVLFCLVGIRMNSRVLSEWPLPSPRDISVPFDVQWAEWFFFLFFVCSYFCVCRLPFPPLLKFDFPRAGQGGAEQSSKQACHFISSTSPLSPLHPPSHWPVITRGKRLAGCGSGHRHPQEVCRWSYYASLFIRIRMRYS